MRLQNIQPSPENIWRFRSQVVYEFVRIYIYPPPASFSGYDGKTNIHWAVQAAAGHIRRRPCVDQYTAVYYEETLEGFGWWDSWLMEGLMYFWLME